MNLKSVCAAMAVTCALVVPVTLPVAALPATTTAAGSAVTGQRPTLVAAASKKPRAVVSAVYSALPHGKVAVKVTSNAAKVQVKYRTASNKKRTVTKRLKRGAVTITLPAGAKGIMVRAKATKRLAASSWTAAVRPTPPAHPAPVPPVTTPPVTKPPADTIAPKASCLSPFYDRTATTISMRIRPGCKEPDVKDADTFPDADHAGLVLRRLEGPTPPKSPSEGVGVALAARELEPVDVGLTPNTQYSYTLWVRDTAGNLSEPRSNSFGTRVAGQPGAVRQLSTDKDGHPSSDHPQEGTPGTGAAVPSPNGRMVAFVSYAPDLVPGDTNGGTDVNGMPGGSDVFVKMLDDGDIVRVSTGEHGEQAAGPGGAAPASANWYGSMAWSPDSSQLLFASDAVNLTRDPRSDEGSALFVKMLSVDGSGDVVDSTGRVVQVNAAQDGTPAAPGGVGSWVRSAEFAPSGEAVVFTAYVPDPGPQQGYHSAIVKELNRDAAGSVIDSTGALTVVSTTEAGQVVGEVDQAVFSPDGRTIAFSVYANPTAGFATGTYVKNLTTDDAGRVLDASGSVVRVDVLPDGSAVKTDSYLEVGAGSPRFSPDGRSLALVGILDAEYHSDGGEVYLKRLHLDADGRVIDGTGTLSSPSERVVSCGPEPGRRYGFSAPSFSPDGTRLSFIGDYDGLYVQDLATGSTVLVSTSADGTPASGVYDSAAVGTFLGDDHIVFTAWGDDVVGGSGPYRPEVFAKTIG